MTGTDRPSSFPVLIIAAGIGCLVFFLMPLGTVHRGPPNPLFRCQTSLHSIGIALRQYHDEYGSYPPAYVASKPTPERMLETVERFEEDL